MEPNILGPVIVGSIIYLGIVFFLIRYAVKADDTVRLLKIHARLLAQIAKQQGVEKETINEIMKSE